MSRIFSRAAAGSISILLMASFALPAAEKPKESPAEAQARQDVKAALQAEAAGDNARRAECLADAVKSAPELAEANWHLARIRQADNWLALPDAEQKAAEDRQLAEYQTLRDQTDNNPKLLRNLARWCLKAGWNEHARLHYAQLLARNDVDAETQAEAIKRLDLRYVNGSWVMGEELRAQMDKARKAEDAIRKLRPRLKRLQEAIDGEDYVLREKAIKEFQSFDDPTMIPVLETFLLDGGAEFQLQAVSQLAKFGDYSATESLVRYAVLADSVSVRDKAADILKSRSRHEYVPLLLSGLIAPIKSQFEVKALPNGTVTYTHVFVRETPQQKFVAVANDVTTPRFVPRHFKAPRGTRGMTLGVVFDDTMWSLENRLSQEMYQRARENELAANLVSQPASFSNIRVFRALEKSTGEQIADDVQAWGQWWQEYNQYYWPQQTYVSYSRSQSQYFTPPPVQVVKGQSCFIAGTLIRTQLGLRQIESVQVGDRVLAQDQNSGELAYRTVLRTTIRPPAKMVRIDLDGNHVTATLGHPFWVDGHGWKMAKELAVGDLLHSLSGAVRIDKVEPAGEDKAYNLVVDDFNTYFVGQQGLLVHDNEFRKPTRAIVPGLIDEPAALGKK